MKLKFFINTLQFFSVIAVPLTNSNGIKDNNYESSRENKYEEELITNLRQFNIRQQRTIYHNIIQDDFEHFNKTSNEKNPYFESSSAPVAATLELPITEHNSNLRDILSNNNNYSREENSCFRMSKVFYNNSCLELLSSCGDGKWLILDFQSALQDPPKIKPICSKRKCKYNQFYWYEKNVCYNKTKDYEIICPSGNTVATDYFGHGKCVCKPLNGLHKDGKCYPLYTQGACLSGYLFIEKNNKIECVKNPCDNTSLVPFNEDGKKMCYELGTQGPCSSYHSFKVSLKTKEPACVSDALSLVFIDPPKFCNYTEPNEKCPPLIKVEDSQSYIDRIIEYAHKKKTRKK